MLGQVTFLWLGGTPLSIILGLTDTLDVDLLSPAQLATVVALGYRSTFLFNLKQGTVGVLAGGRPVPFDACFAGGQWRER